MCAKGKALTASEKMSRQRGDGEREWTYKRLQSSVNVAIEDKQLFKSHKHYISSNGKGVHHIVDYSIEIQTFQSHFLNKVIARHVVGPKHHHLCLSPPKGL